MRLTEKDLAALDRAFPLPELSDPLIHRLNSRVEVPVVPVHDDVA
jgi:hypothetical protein